MNTTRQQTIEKQTRITQLLNEKLQTAQVKKEWDVEKDRTDGYNRQNIYAPKIDIAVGPFLINYSTEEARRELENAFSSNQNMIEQIKNSGELFDGFRYNQNPRCLIAIEIETSGTRKHLIGDIFNASIIGKVGVIVPTNKKMYAAFKRIIDYLKFAQDNEKISPNVFKNIILIKYEELIGLLEGFRNEIHR